MTQLATHSSISTQSNLSVSYKSPLCADGQGSQAPEALITTDLKFNIIGLNNTASIVLKFLEADVHGQSLFNLVKFEMIGTSLDVAIDDLFLKGQWQGDVTYSHHKGKSIFYTRCNLIKDETGENKSIIVAVRSLSKTGGEGNFSAATPEEIRQMEKMYERYHFAVSASSDAIWDMDMDSGAIYRSDTFSAFSGYSTAEIAPSFEWFFEKIHEQDRSRVKVNVDYCIANKLTTWEMEYRFQVADGSYRHLLDKARAIINDDTIVRVIGTMQDITERKKLEGLLLHEQVQKQKMINQATIKAQEKERNRISGELHDNVNQLLMSAKLHICVAKNKEEAPNELLEKANEYLLMAVEEIRGLSKKLTSTVITNVGLQKSISDIASTMALLQEINVHTYINDDAVAKLSAEQQLMVYRIIQEQTNNILKYAETRESIISLKIVDGNIELIISDNGKGFNKAEQKATGIGFINIFNRVDAYNGKVEIITTPGNGCTLIINFPVAA